MAALHGATIAVIASPTPTRRPTAGCSRPCSTPHDATLLRDALSRFATGVTGITSLGLEGEPRGATANAFSSVSLDPPLIRRKAGPPSSIYVRADTNDVAAVQSLLAPTANTQAPDEVNVSQASGALTARAAAAGAFDSLFLGLGVVALIVGAVGVANIMIISVLERPLGNRPPTALGATKSQIRTRFPGESVLLAAIGGIVGVLAGAIATVIYASSKGWPS